MTTEQQATTRSAQESDRVCIRWQASWAGCGRGAFYSHGIAADPDLVTCPGCLKKLGRPDVERTTRGR